MLAAGKAEVAGRVICAEKALAFLLLLVQLSVAADAVVLRLVLIRVVSHFDIFVFITDMS